MKTRSEPIQCLRPLPLAACLVAALGAAHAQSASARAPALSGALPVTSCADDGSPDTLRSVIATAASGAVVDLTQLECSTITLTSGAIPISVDDLTVQGPGANALAIDGADVNRVFYHSGLGTLAISGLAVVNGRNDAGAPPLGGCIYTKGTLDLAYVAVSGCHNDGLPASGKYTVVGGAGVAAAGDLLLEHSTISGNAAAATGLGNVGYYTVVGGGVFVVGNATVVDSTISGNSVSGPPGMVDYRAVAGGILANGSLAVRNSTIAFNSAGGGGGGIFDASGSAIDLESTIVADNTVEPTAAYAADIGGYGTLTGANNLIVASDLVLPAGTLGDDPLLQPLADNGGPTPTHALPFESPALDTGNNTSNLSFDQRGDGHVRVSGANADIGAFEYEQSFSVPTVAKNFTPDTIAVADTSTLTITLTNPNPAQATLSADLVDILPTSMRVADATAAMTDCPSGFVMIDDSAVSVTLSAGAIIPGQGGCTVSVPVRSDVAGALVNTIAADALQTDLGTYPNAASAQLTVTAAPPLLSKAFAPDTITAGEVTMLTITLVNDNGVAARLTGDLVDTLPPPLVVADSPAATSDCTDATLVADPGSATVALGLGAGIPPDASCVISAPVTASLPGIFTNTMPVAALVTSLGSNPDAASADLTVTEAPPADRIFADGFDDGTRTPHTIRLPGTL
jgi:hypothetical protein